MTYICDLNGAGAIGNMAIPLMAAAGVITGIVIALGYMIGEWLQNPKVSLWAKTETLQLGVSAAVVIFMLSSVRFFCGFDFASVGALFGLAPAQGAASVFDAARLYLVDAGTYIRDGMVVARYHLEAYNVLQMRSVWQCDENAALNVILCMFGSVLGFGASNGVSMAPESGYSYAAAALGLAFNSYIFSYLSVLNYYFILEYVYSGMVYFFLPLGIFLRSMPYMRTLGSLFMSVSVAFLFVYPLTLAVFYLDVSRTPEADRILDPKPSEAFAYYVGHEGDVKEVESGGSIAASVLTLGIFDVARGGLYDNLFPKDSVEMEVIQRSGNAFLLGVFIPSLALLMAAGSVAYLNRFLGEEIDLSRVVQMV